MKKFVCILLVFVLMFALASVAFADIISSERGNTDVDPDGKPTAPQTGETGAIYWVIAAMLLAVGTVFFCGKKLVAEK